MRRAHSNQLVQILHFRMVGSNVMSPGTLSLDSHIFFYRKESAESKENGLPGRFTEY